MMHDSSQHVPIRPTLQPGHSQSNACQVAKVFAVTESTEHLGIGFSGRKFVAVIAIHRTENPWRNRLQICVEELLGAFGNQAVQVGQRFEFMPETRTDLLAEEIKIVAHEEYVRIWLRGDFGNVLLEQCFVKPFIVGVQIPKTI
jgi:hypothetical protein